MKYAFTLQDGKGGQIQTFTDETVARIELENVFLFQRKCNWYLFKHELNKNGQSVDKSEIARRIRSNRYA